MKKRVYLHIGTHKTGTTSLQSWALANADALTAQGIFHPKTGRMSGSNHFSVFWRYFRHQPELDYAALLRPWIEGFGRKQVRILPYSSLSPDSAGVLPTLLAESG